MDNKTIFNDFAKAFERKIDKSLSIRLQFEIYDTENGENDIWQVNVSNGNVTLYNKEETTVEKIFVLSKNTLLRLYKNELSPDTAFSENPGGKNNWDIDPNILHNPMNSLISNKYPEEEGKIYREQGHTKERIDYITRLKKFYTFFSKDYPTKIIINENNCTYIHNNISGIGLYANNEGGKYYIFHAYFSIKKDEIYDMPAVDYNLYVISGKGVIKIGDEELDIEEKNYYLINPKEYNIIGNKEEKPLEIIVIRI